MQDQGETSSRRSPITIDTGRQDEDEEEDENEEEKEGNDMPKQESANEEDDNQENEEPVSDLGEEKDGEEDKAPTAREEEEPEALAGAKGEEKTFITELSTPRGAYESREPTKSTLVGKEEDISGLLH